MILRLRHLCAAAAFALLALPLAGGCSNQMEQKECDKLRGEAFDMLNEAQHCNDDNDCKQSAWPGCQKPVSGTTMGKIATKKEAYEKGKCEEPKSECKAPPPVYCKQGLCVHKEKGTAEGSGNTPADQIQIQ